MTSTLTTIARTISEELERAVAAAENAQNAGLDFVLKEIATADRKRREALAQCDEIQSEAATMISEALKLRERAEEDFTRAIEATTANLAKLKTPEKTRIGNKKKTAIAASTLDQVSEGSGHD